jgi:L-aspartate oxidase
VQVLRDSGLDPATELIPVSPAAHYMMGGIATDLHGRSTVAGLFAVGESACTGLHGANRLASNSLSECFVFGARAATAALDEPAPKPLQPPAAEPVAAPSQATREAMWRNAGLVRDPTGLENLRTDPHPLARLVGACALHRQESRGAHRRADHPATRPGLDLHHGVVTAARDVAYERWT